MRSLLPALMSLALVACNGESKQERMAAYLAQHAPAVEPAEREPVDPELIRLELLGFEDVRAGEHSLHFRANVRLTSPSGANLRIHSYQDDDPLVHVLAERESGEWSWVGLDECGTGRGTRNLTSRLDKEVDALASIWLDEPDSASPLTGRAKVVTSYQARDGGPWFEAATEPFDLPQP